MAMAALPAKLRAMIGVGLLACSRMSGTATPPSPPNQRGGVESKAIATTNKHCFVALEWKGWTAWKVPNPDSFPNLEARALCQQGGPNQRSYKFQWRAADGTRAITWSYKSSAPRQDPQIYSTRFPKHGGPTMPQVVDYSCGAETSAELCPNIIGWQEGE